MRILPLTLGFAAALAGAAYAQSSMPGMEGMGGMQGMDHGQMGMNASMLTASDPADGATLAHAPGTLSLTFMHPVMLQTVAITGPGDAPVAATFRRPTSPTVQYGIALPALRSGAYSVTWTASGMGHSMQGTLHFTVQ